MPNLGDMVQIASVVHYRLRFEIKAITAIKKRHRDLWYFGSASEVSQGVDTIPKRQSCLALLFETCLLTFAVQIVV